MKNKHELPSLEIINDLINYNPDTGLFTWKRTTSGWVVEGRIIGTKTEKGYLIVRIKGKSYLLSRLAFYITTGKTPNEVDHINGDRSDNRACNLRDANRRENCFNKSVRNDSKIGVKGVAWCKKRKKWHARSTDRLGKRVHVGFFSSIGEAVIELKKFRREHHGEFAKN